MPTFLPLHQRVASGLVEGRPTRLESERNPKSQNCKFAIRMSRCMRRAVGSADASITLAVSPSTGCRTSQIEAVVRGRVYLAALFSACSSVSTIALALETEPQVFSGCQALSLDAQGPQVRLFRVQVCIGRHEQCQQRCSKRLPLLLPRAATAGREERAR